MPMADINVTPMVDVMLVLLVIFMITAPALKDGIDVDLPKAQTGGSSGRAPATALSLVIDAEGRVHAGRKMIEPAQVSAELPNQLKGHEKEMLTLKAHRKLPYDAVVKVIAVVRSAGISSISIAVDRE